MAKRQPPEANPQMPRREEEPPRRAPGQKKVRVGWCKFEAKRRSFIEGILLEGPEQVITLSPAASYRVKDNKSLLLLSGEIPVKPKDMNSHDFLEDLEDGDPVVGAPPVDLKLIKQG